MKFKSDIEVQAGIKDSAGSSGNAGSILSSTSTGVTWIDNYSDWTSVVKHVVKNNGVAVIPKGSPVYVTGSDGTNMLVGLAGNGSEATSSKTMGIMQTQLDTSGSTQTGYVITEGLLQGLNTAGLTAGDPIWLGPNGTLIYGLINKPYAPAHLVFIGIVTKISAGNGEIFVNVQNGFELNEIHDVDIKTNVPINGDILGYNGTLWVNKTIAGWLGYTPANDANVVHLTGTETITGAKTFTTAVTIDKATANTDALLLKVGGNQQGRLTINNDGGFDLFTSIDNSGYGINLDANDSNGILFYADNPSMPKFIVGDNYNRSQQDLYSPKFIKDGGNSTQYLKADGSVSTAMNSRIEVNFVATSGQTTFVTPYEVGQIDVYYNGSKLYPNEFTATNGTDVILVTGATLNAQISIVKYVSSLSTTAIRNETTFTTTAGQTTFAVNYSPGQVDVFYNGSKLNISEFTAVNGTSVVLGFACAAGESIVIDSYVNQISGASGTPNYVSKFTGAASLGDSQIFDNGYYVGIGTTAATGSKLIVTGYTDFWNSTNTLLRVQHDGSRAMLQSFTGGGTGVISLNSSGGNVLIGTTTDNGNKLQVDGSSYFNGDVGIGITTPSSTLEIAKNDQANGATLSITNSASSSTWVANDIIGSVDFKMTDPSNAQKVRGQIKVINTTTGPFTYPSTNAMIFSTASVSTLYEQMRITSAGRVGIGQDNPGFKLDVVDNGTAYVGRLYNVNTNNAGGAGCLYLQGGTYNSSDTTTNMISFRRNDGTEIGSIKRNGATTVSYNTSSDYRLKDDLREFNGLEKISAIKVYDFQWIDTDERNYGVLAHELKNVVGYSVSGEKDEIDENGKILAQSVDYSKLVPILIKAIQELKAEIEILKNK